MISYINNVKPAVILAISLVIVLLTALSRGDIYSFSSSSSFASVSSSSSSSSASFSFSSSSSSSSTSSDTSCFCQLGGAIDDCLCNVDTVDYFNNMKIFPRLQSILHKPYFRYFQYNANKGCPFWNNAADKCTSMGCGVRSCTPEELPPALKSTTHENKYSEEAQSRGGGQHCHAEREHDSKVDDHISDSARESLRSWQDHDDSLGSFCEFDAEQCPDCDYVDLTINPERFTGYDGEAARKIWRAIYEENCFKSSRPVSSLPTSERFSAAFFQDSLNDLCLEKRAFFRAISGLHSSVTIHLCANHPIENQSPFATVEYGPNLDEFQKRFDPLLTNDQGPYWLRNLYFVYLLELRALTKAAPYLESQFFYTGKDEEDKDTQIAVKELLNLIRSFPDQFDESAMFADGGESLKEEFRAHFHNISRVMDCVSCDKCKLWGKLQVTGLGTALKILFSDDAIWKKKEKKILSADELQRLLPPDPDAFPDFKLSRNEIVALFNAFGRISTSIQQLERFRQMMK